MRIKLKYTNNVSLYIEGETPHVIKTNRAKWIGLFVGIIAVVICIWGSIIFGYTNTSWKLALDAFFHFNGSNEHIIIQNVRLPRALIAASVGASLAIAGCLMQTLTKNPLASPDFIGLNSGLCVLHSCSNCNLFSNIIISFHMDCLFRSGGCGCTCICF